MQIQWKPVVVSELPNHIISLTEEKEEGYFNPFPPAGNVEFF